MTSKKFGIALLSLIVLAIFAVGPVSAVGELGILNITPGDTVFIGEEGINIAAAVGGATSGTIYWREDSSATPQSIYASDTQKFQVSEADFGSKIGTWYNDSACTQQAFVVSYPYLNNVQIFDADMEGGTDITGKTVVEGDNLQIAFQTNLNTLINQRLNASSLAGANFSSTGSSFVLKVKTPDGATLNGLINATKGVTSLKNLMPSNSKYFVQNTSVDNKTIWDTKNPAYNSGTYSIWVESNINKMKDNLGSVSGKTISPTVQVTIDKEDVTLTADKETVIRNNAFTVTINGKAKTDYYLWITGISTYPNKSNVSDNAPWFTPNQNDVTPIPKSANTSALNASSVYYKAVGSGSTIGDDIPRENRTLDRYWAVLAKTDKSGKITVSLTTDGYTKDSTYTIRAEKYLNNTQGDDQLYDTVKVKIEKGTVTITAEGSGTYYLGEEIALSGTDTDTSDVYLFVTGPNLASDGAPLTSPTGPEGNTHVVVKSDDTWEYKWSTSGVTLDAGSYTVYAVSENVDQSHLSDAKYDTLSLNIKTPYVTATTSASTVAKGDSLYIRGTALGDPTPGVGIWILGKNYWNGKTNSYRLVTETVDDDGTFEYELGTADTKHLDPGQYFVVVQHPMYNDEFNVWATGGNDGLSATSVVTSPNKSTTTNYNSQFVIAGPGKLQGSAAAEALISSINSNDIDDTYTKLTFLVQEPWIRINTIGDKYVGESFTISGTTNLAVDDRLIVDVTSSSFTAASKSQASQFSGDTQNVKVTEGDSFNEWTMNVDGSTFQADEYIVNVEAIEADQTTTATFNVLKPGEKTVATTSPTKPSTIKPTTQATTTETPEKTASPGFGAFVALIGLGAVAALVMRKD
ncbi:PGF-CTERM protein [Methanomicrobium sp. W14]|uniref:MEMAR_RS02690 family S-layer glycoprotein n=1 Tax=Methanomicrobium sp. W14 TaxID=2817839 RepID=UPI001AE73867|nr:MEMAR_RS02690 family S-layer glycoprotein [Methanomicrobium sp. W14]MBP2133671.1 PGF-CTERM protein [Methanomicrobium sp. W14]